MSVRSEIRLYRQFLNLVFWGFLWRISQQIALDSMGRKLDYVSLSWGSKQMCGIPQTTVYDQHTISYLLIQKRSMKSENGGNAGNLEIFFQRYPKLPSTLSVSVCTLGFHTHVNLRNGLKNSWNIISDIEKSWIDIKKLNYLKIV